MLQHIYVSVSQKLKQATANNNRKEIISQRKTSPKQRLNIVIYIICMNKKQNILPCDLWQYFINY